MLKKRKDYWITYDVAVDLYSISKRKIQDIAHQAKAVKKANKVAYINVSVFERFIEKYRIGWEVKEMNEMVIPLKKKFVRIKDGAKHYSMGVEKFTELAKYARAIYKIDKLVLVNTEILDEFLENYRL